MQIIRPFVSILFFTIASISNAQTPVLSPSATPSPSIPSSQPILKDAPRTKGKIIVKPGTYIEEGSSSQKRLTKRYGMYGSATGLLARSTSEGENLREYGYGGEYFFSPDSFAALDYKKASNRFGDAYESLEFSSVALTANWFLANSFFVGGGVEYQTLVFEKWTDSSQPSGSYSSNHGTYYGSTSTFGAKIQAGSKWNWDYFSLGVIWAGVYKSFKNPSLMLHSDSIDDYAPPKEDPGAVFADMNIELLRVFLGIDF